jgi:hypothetical protein
MDWTGAILLSVVVMLAAIASIMRDLRAYRRLGAGRGREVRPALPPVQPEATAIHSATLAGTPGDPDPIHELALRLGALRVLGLEHVRSAHPLFQTGEDPAEVVRDLTPRPALMFSELPPAPAAPKRRPRHGKMRSMAPLRLVVARTARPQA